MRRNNPLLRWCLASIHIGMAARYLDSVLLICSWPLMLWRSRPVNSEVLARPVLRVPGPDRVFPGDWCNCGNGRFALLRNKALPEKAIAMCK